MIKKLLNKIKNLIARLLNRRPTEKNVTPIRPYVNEKILEGFRSVGSSISEFGKNAHLLSQALRGFTKSAEPKKSKNLGSKNKSQGTSKVRRKMSARSNQINRKRIKNWHR